MFIYLYVCIVSTVHSLTKRMYKYLNLFKYVFYTTVKAAYKESAYKELILIFNLYQGTSSLYVVTELRLSGTYFHGPDEFLISEIYCIIFNMIFSKYVNVK